MELEFILTKLKTAFINETIPENISDGCSRDICKEIEQRYHKIPNDLLTDIDIYFLSTNLILLNDDAFRYYSQKVIEYGLLDPESVDFDAFIQNFLYYEGMNDYQNYMKIRLEKLTIEESYVIHLAFEYWSKFDAIKKIGAI